MKRYKTSEIFVPGGMPYFTYISRSAKQLEERLRLAEENLCKLVTVIGPTKSGKTVLTNKVFPRKEAVWIDGGIIGEEDDLWLSILEQIEGFTEQEIGESYETTSSINGGTEAQINLPFLIKGKGSVGGTYSKARGSETGKTLSLSPRVAAISQLRKKQVPLIIDDFHYINREFQGRIVRALKPLVFEGVPIILIAIPHRRYDAIKVEREMTSRIETIEIPVWEIDELLQIPEEGFPLLNMELYKEFAYRFAQESYGSPHLMQEFCQTLAYTHGIKETQKTKAIISNVSKELFIKVAESTGRVIFDRLSKGPRQRADRIQRRLKSGESADIYVVTLLALAHIKPGLDTIEYENLRTAIREILDENIPQAQEVSRVLEKMSEIALKDEASTPVLDWEKEEQKLHITDPFFAYYLKWGIEEKKI